jgi:hypothetical protein
MSRREGTYDGVRAAAGARASATGSPRGAGGTHGVPPAGPAGGSGPSGRGVTETGGRFVPADRVRTALGVPGPATGR